MVLFLLAEFETEPPVSSSQHWFWGSISGNNIWWLQVPFEIQPEEAIRQNVRKKSLFCKKSVKRPQTTYQ